MEQMKSSEVFEDHFQLSGATLTAQSRNDGGGKPPSSLSAPPSACHSPFATPTSPSPSPSPGPEKRLPVVQAARKRSSTFTRFREHVRTMKEKLNVKKGRGRRREKMVRELFGMGEEERVVEACECSLSTTAGPIPGNLFISTHKLAFCSHRSIALHSSTHGIITTPYKVCIPVNKIQEANQTENTTNPEQKFLKIVTHDNHEFWFMVFLGSASTQHLMALQRALFNSISSASSA